MLNIISKVCVLLKGGFYINLCKIDSAVSFTTIIGLKDCINAGEIKKGMKVMIADFGVGLSLGGVILKF